MHIPRLGWKKPSYSSWGCGFYYYAETWEHQTALKRRSTFKKKTGINAVFWCRGWVRFLLSLHLHRCVV